MSFKPPFTIFVTIAVVTSIFAGAFVIPTTANHSEKVHANDTVKITDIKRTQSIVNTNDTTSLRFRIDNTGKDPITVQPDITVNGGQVVDYHKEPNPSTAPTFNVEGEESIVVRADIVFTQETDDYESSNPGTTSFDISLDGFSASQTYNYTVSDSATTYNSSLESTGERQDISKYITAYKDERDSSENQNYDDSIPPVKETSSGFESDASGEIRQFNNVRDENREPMIIDSVNDELRVGLHINNVPTEEHYAMRVNYRVDNGAGVLFNLVKSDGTEIDKNTTYELGSKDRTTTYHRLSDKEQDYISSQNRIYMVVENINTEQTNVKVFNSEAESAGRPVMTENPIYTNLTLSTNKDEYNVGEKIRITGEYENEGNHYRTQTVELFRDGNLIERKNVTVAPNKTNSFSFVDAIERSGVYEYRVENTSTYVRVGSGSGVSGNATAVIDLNESEESDKSEMGDRYTSDSIFIDASGVYHIDTDQEIVFNGSNSFHTDPNRDIEGYTWSQSGSGFVGGAVTNPFGEEDRFEASWDENGTKQVELTVEADDGSTDTQVVTVKVGDTDPIPKYVYQPQNPVVGQDIDFDARDSSHPTQPDDSLTYNWDFGDGTTDSTDSEIIRHEYSSTGVYNVKLTVEDKYGNTDTRTKTVTVESAEIVADFFYEPFEPSVNEQVKFNADDSEAKSSETIVEYNWDVDGTKYNSAGSEITHKFSNDGEHPVTLEVVTDNGNTETVTKTVEVIGKEFTVITDDDRKRTGTSQTVQFDATPTRDPEGQIEEWKWEFGDGTVIPYGTAGPKETHSYSNEGVYTATVYARGDGYTGSDTVRVNVSNQPVADAGDDQTKEWIHEFTVDGSGSYAVGQNNDIEEYKWEMGDGTVYTNTDPTQKHKYNSPGQYTVTLTVTDSNGDTDTDTVQLTYTKDPPIAMITDSPDDSRSDNINETRKTISQQQELELYGNESYEPSEPSEPIHRYKWDMDDGTTYNTKNINHQFKTPGVYNVTLTVEDKYGNKDTTYVNVTATDGIVVDYSVYDTYDHQLTGEQKQKNMTDRILSPGYAYNFNASETQDTANQKEYRWDMGDGTTYTTTDETIQHAYQTSGTYEPTVDVYIDGSFEGTKSRVVTVEDESNKNIYYKYGDEPEATWLYSDGSSGTGMRDKWDSRLFLRADAGSYSDRQFGSTSVDLTNVDSVTVEYEVEQGQEVERTTYNGETSTTIDTTDTPSVRARLYGAGGGSGQYYPGGNGGYTDAVVNTSQYDSIGLHVGSGGTSSIAGGTGRHNGGDGTVAISRTSGGGGASTELFLPSMPQEEAIMVAHGGGGSGEREYFLTSWNYAGGGGGAKGGEGGVDANDGEGIGDGGDGGYQTAESYRTRTGGDGGYFVDDSYLETTSTTEVGTGSEGGGRNEAGVDGRAIIGKYTGYEQKTGTQGGISVTIDGETKTDEITGADNYSAGRITVDTSDITGTHTINVKGYAYADSDGTVEVRTTKVQGE